MAATQETLRRIQSLEQLYRSGYHSEAIDTTIDKLVAIERARVGQEVTRLEERLRRFEQQYQLDSATFHTQFEAGDWGTRQTSLNGVPSTGCGYPPRNNSSC